MKANTLKRAVALALAVLILLGTLGYFLSTVAYGLETTQGIKDVTYTMSARPLKKGNKADIKVSFKNSMALVRPSFWLIRLSSCSMLMA